MKDHKNSVVGLILFVIGIVILALAFVLLAPLFKYFRPQYIFACVSALLLYLAVFAPIAFGLPKGGAASIAASGAVYFKGLTIYGVVTVAAAVLAFKGIPLSIAVVIQAVALFVFTVWLFLAFITKNHIESTLRDEEIKKSPVMELRSKSRKLAALAAGLEKDSSIRVSAEKIAENMRYLSPGNTKAEHDLEYKMIALLDSIIADSYFASGGDMPSDTAESKLRDFDALYRERKNML